MRYPISNEDVSLLWSLGWVFHLYGDDFQEGWVAPGGKYRDSWWRSHYNWEEVELFLDGYKAAKTK